MQLLPSYELWRNTGSPAAAPPMPAVANKLPSFHPGGNAGAWNQAGAAPTLQRAQLLRPSDLPLMHEFTTTHPAGQHSLSERFAAQRPAKAVPLQSPGVAHGNAMPLLPQCSDVYHLAGKHRFAQLMFSGPRSVCRLCMNLSSGT